MIRNIALALAVAAVSTSAAAQSNRKPTWDDLLKPLDVKTNPNVPLAPPQPAGTPAQPITPQTNALVDGCVHMALARVPKVEGARVASTKPEYLRSHSSSYLGTLEFWDIHVTIDFNGRPVHYSYACRITPAYGTAELAPFR